MKLRKLATKKDIAVVVVNQVRLNFITWEFLQYIRKTRYRLKKENTGFKSFA